MIGKTPHEVVFGSKDAEHASCSIPTVYQLTRAHLDNALAECVLPLSTRLWYDNNAIPVPWLCVKDLPANLEIRFLRPYVL